VFGGRLLVFMAQVSNTTMTPFFSEKLRIVSFFSIIVVFYIHAGFPDEVNETMTIPVIVRSCIAGVFGPCAVPMFYAISGFLFFYGIRKGITDVFKKMRKRIRTLLIPFIIAALFFPAFFMLMEFIPGASAHINSDSYIDKFGSMPMIDIILSLFYDCGNGMPWAYHLWFLRDLIIIIAFTPILYYIRKGIGFWSICIVLLLYFLFPQVTFLYAMYWFVGGSFIIDKTQKLPQWSIYMMFVLFITMATYRQFNAYEIWKYIKILEISFGVCSIWSIYDIFISKEFRINSIPFLLFACQFTFFLYLYHEPAFHIIVKAIPMALGNNELGYTLSFLLSPLIFAPICITIGYFLKKFTPNLYNTIVGGR
jgi:surface polysaccharide O-acyltransferase-like enzyme